MIQDYELKIKQLQDNQQQNYLKHLGDFERALEEGANVNKFDQGYTPLMTIIMGVDDSPTNLKMMTLLLQHQNLNINAQETKESNTALHLAFLVENRNFVQMLLRHPNMNTNIKNKVFLLQDQYLEPRYNRYRAGLIEDAECKQWFSYTPQGYIEKIGRIQKKEFSHLIPSPVSNETNEKELFLPIIGELSKFITRPICFPNNEYWYYNRNTKSTNRKRIIECSF